MATVVEPVKGLRTQEPGQETPKQDSIQEAVGCRFATCAPRGGGGRYSPSAGTESGARPGGPAECR
jgi:hypothetical protein